MLLITISYHQLVKRQVSDLPFFACFHHFGEKFFASRHNSLRVVFVHIYPTRSFFLGRRKHELAVFVLSEFDHDGPGFRSGAARSVCPLDRHGAYLSFRKLQRCCHFSAHVFFRLLPGFVFCVRNAVESQIAPSGLIFLVVDGAFNSGDGVFTVAQFSSQVVNVVVCLLRSEFVYLRLRIL